MMSAPNNRNSKRSTGGRDDKDNQNRPKLNTILPIALLAVVLVLFINFLYGSYTSSMMEEIKYSEFVDMVTEGKVAEVEIQADRLLIQPKEQQETSDMNQKILYTGYQNGDYDELTKLLNDKDVTYYWTIVDEVSPLISILLSYIIPIALFYLLLSFLMRNISGKMAAACPSARVRQCLYGKGNRCNLRRCSWSGRSKGIPAGNHRLSP